MPPCPVGDNRAGENLEPPPPILAWLLVLVWAAGQLLGGRTFLGNLMFHLPTPAVALAVGLLAWVRSRSRWPHRTTAALALAPVLVLAAEYRLAGTEDPASPSLQVVHWNAGRGQVFAGWKIGAPLLAERRPDLIALSEAPRGDRLESLMARLPRDYRMVRRLGLALVARGELEPQLVLAESDLQAWLVRWTPPGRPSLLILMADLPSNPLIPRDPGLRQVVELIEREAPDLVLGDFNAPRQSWALRHLPAGWRHCHDEAGRGLGLTWPTPLPMFAIDQCIASPRLELVSHTIETTWASDHRLQHLRVRLR